MPLLDRTESDAFEAHLAAPEDIEPILAMFEQRFFEDQGVQLGSSEFYARYCRGEFDSPVGLAWSTYYEAYIELADRRSGGALRHMVPPALAAC